MTTKTMSRAVEQQFLASSGRQQVLIDNMLTESEGVTMMNVLEEGKGGGPLIVEGKVGQCGIPTANKRLYERKIMEREITRLQEKIDRRAALAAVDHPGDGKSRIREAGAICVGLRVEADGSVWGKYEVVEESSGGKDLAAFLRRGCSIGMSSRGLGSTRMDSSGNHVVGEDFKLHGFDFVADPACRDAFPALVSEDIDPDTVTENELRVRFPTLVEGIEERARQAAADVALQEAVDAEDRIRAEVEADYKAGLGEAREALRDEVRLEAFADAREALRDDFAAKLLQVTQDIKAESLEIARSELLSDPQVAGAKRFMESLAEQLVPFHPDPERQTLMDELQREIEELREAVQQREAVVEEAETRQQELLNKAQNLGKRLYLERSLRGFENPDQIAKMVGDVDEFDSVDKLAEQVRVVIRQVNEAEREAADRANEVVKINEHKAELASTKAQVLEDKLDRVRTEFADRIENMTTNLRAEIHEKDALLDEAAGEIDRLRRQLREANETAESAGLWAYATQRAQGHPRHDDIMAAVRTGRVTSKDGVRQLAESLDYRAAEPGGAAERIRRTLGRGQEAPPAELQPSHLSEDRQPIPGFSGLNTTMGELKRLAGIGDNNGRRRF